MYYDWPDFCGYRFALFHYATKETGGHADFDYFHVKYKKGGYTPSIKTGGQYNQQKHTAPRDCLSGGAVS